MFFHAVFFPGVYVCVRACVQTYLLYKLNVDRLFSKYCQKNKNMAFTDGLVTPLLPNTRVRTYVHTHTRTHAYTLTFAQFSALICMLKRLHYIAYQRQSCRPPETMLPTTTTASLRTTILFLQPTTFSARTRLGASCEGFQTQSEEHAQTSPQFFFSPSLSLSNLYLITSASAFLQPLTLSLSPPLCSSLSISEGGTT